MLSLLLMMQALSFTVVHHKDPITDTETIGALVATAEDDAIVVTCSPAEQDVKVIFSSKRRYLMRTGWLTAEHPLIYRFDANEPVTEDWHYDEHTAHLYQSGDIIPFIRGLLHAQRLVIRARNYRGDTVDATFLVGNAKPAVAEVLTACGETKVAKALREELS